MANTFTLNVQGEIRFPDIALLAQAMSGRQITAPAPAPMAAMPAPVNPVPSPVSPAPVPTAAVNAVPPAIPTAPAPANPGVPVTEPPRFTADDIARAGAELAQQGPDKIAALTGLLSQYGLQAVTDIRPEQLGPFATALRGLGARI